MTGSGTPATTRRLTIASLAYIALSLIGAVIAITQNLPAEPMGEGSGTGRPVLQEFLVGNGTAMSPGLPWLAFQAVLTLLIRRQDLWGRISVVLLGFAALLTGIFATTEPIFRRTFSAATFDPAKALVEAGMVVIPLAIVLLAVIDFRRRLRGS